jgi:hypothetical protein
MNLIKFGKRSCIGVLTALLLIASTSPADAGPMFTRIVNGNTAIPVPPPDSSCILIVYGGVYNLCSRTLTVNFPMPYDYPGGRTIIVTANAPSTSATVGCNAVTTDPYVTTVTQSGWHYVTTFGGPTTIPLTLSTIYTYGDLWVQCQIGPNAMVNVIALPEWSEP